jgi:imidazolonepropionase-like amidohydrolase
MKSLFGFFLAISAYATSAQQIIDSKNREIVFRSVNVVPMDKERILPNQVVVVKNGIITAMGIAGKIKYSKTALVVDAKGKYLIPGLAEMHAHVPMDDDLEPMKEVLLLFAVNGVTTIRGMQGHPRHLELRDKIQSGEIMGPRFFTAGPGLSGGTVTSPESGAQMVREQKQAGYDFLKLLPGLSYQSFNAIVRTANEVHISFAGHVSFAVGIWNAIDAGYATIDHLDGFIEGLVPNIDTMTEQQTGLFGMFIASKADKNEIPKLMTSLREHHIWVVPTQSLAERWFAPDKDPNLLGKDPEMKYMSPATLKNWIQTKKTLMSNAQYNRDEINDFIKLRRKLIYECNKNGVSLLLGSDAPQVFDVPGFSIHHELQYIVAAGLTPYQALRTGTINVASFFNRSNDMGIIKKGAVADLVLLNGNPLKDIRQTTKIEGVMLGSKWLSKSYIDKTLKTLIKK